MKSRRGLGREERLELVNSNRSQTDRTTEVYVYVAVQFYPWFKFYFLFWGSMVMYDNEFETKENKI